MSVPPPSQPPQGQPPQGQPPQGQPPQGQPPQGQPPQGQPPQYPPPGAPPPGSYYQAPPPSSSGGCWKAAGITCAVLIVLAAVGVFFTVRAVKTAMHNKSGVFGQVMSLGTSVSDGIRIQQAVVRYHTTNGHYPATLMTLVSDGSIDGKLLHSGMDTDPNPGHVSWVYTRPAEGASRKTPILKLHYRLNIPGANTTRQSQDSDIIINLDGTTTSDTSYSTQTHYGT